MSNSRPPILITGAAGFIGFHTAMACLKENRKVIGIDNLNDYYDIGLKQSRLALLEKEENFTFVKADIADRTALENIWFKHGPFKHVIHLAAQAGVRHSIKDPYAYIHSNCLGHLTILEMCRTTEDFEHLVYASSSSVYGLNKKTPFSVKDKTDKPASLYAATKKSGELMSLSYAHLYKIPQTGLRFFTVYGPWGRPDMSPYIFASAIQNEEKVPVFNKGKMKRDFTYIDDIVDGILKTINAPPEKKDLPHQIFNLGNHKSEKLMDFISAIEKALDKKADIDFKPMQQGDVEETYADISETAKAVHYKPKTSIKDGVPHYIDWFKSYYGDHQN